MASSAPTLQSLQQFARQNRALAADDDEDTPMTGEGGGKNDEEEVVGVSVDLGDAENAVAVKTVKKRAPRPKLTPQHLMLPGKGVAEIYDEFPRVSFDASPGNEAASLKKLIRMYREWAYGVFPQRCLEDFVEEVRGFGNAHGSGDKAMLTHHLGLMRNMEANRRTGGTINKNDLRDDAMDKYIVPDGEGGEAAPLVLDEVGGGGNAGDDGPSAGTGAANNDAADADHEAMLSEVFGPARTTPTAPTAPTAPAGRGIYNKPAPARPSWEDPIEMDADDLARLDALEAMLAAKDATGAQ